MYIRTQQQQIYVNKNNRSTRFANITLIKIKTEEFYNLRFV